MLKQRIITAAILIPVFIFLVLKLNSTMFCMVTGIFVILGAFEWSGLMGVKRFPHNIIFPIIVAILLVLSLYLYIPTAMYASLAWWITASFLVFIYPKASNGWGNGVIVRGLMGILVLIPAWMAINFIRQVEGPYALLFLFVLIWGADSAAYFVGKKWGKHKLAFQVSPGKTWQGFIGAILMTVVIALLASLLIKTPPHIIPGVVILSVITVVFSVMGDLFESMLKRREGIKDSGVLFPGHGGVLDRIDSLTAAAPIFVLCGLLLQKIYY